MSKLLKNIKWVDFSFKTLATSGKTSQKIWSAEPPPQKCGNIKKNPKTKNDLGGGFKKIEPMVEKSNIFVKGFNNPLPLHCKFFL
jgi:hypothetical protein